MIRQKLPAHSHTFGVPRVRGDDPVDEIVLPGSLRVPRVRGDDPGKAVLAKVSA